MTTGVLALQGAFVLHQQVLSSLGEKALLVRDASQLNQVNRLVIPGGESTTMSMLAERFGLLGPLKDFAASGNPVFGTCAGAILLASEIVDGRSDQHCLAALDISVRRNAFGRQVDSFEEKMSVEGLSGGDFNAVFIRAPVIERSGSEVEVLGTVGGSPALVRSGQVLASTFHPELSGDSRIHELFLGL